MSSSAPSSPTRASFEEAQQQALPTLITFLNNVPPQLTALLVELGPYIARVRRFAEALSWKASYPESWLLLGMWWAMCLLSEFTLRYLLLFTVAALYVYLSYFSATSKTRPAVTEQSLQSTVIDLSTIESLLPSISFRLPILPWKMLARVLAILYVPSLMLTWFVPLKILFGIFGTVIFIWRAQWALTARESLWRSAWFRRGLSRMWAILSGQAPAPVVLSSIMQSGEAGHSIRFLIMIYENQRWWVGLDWTAALLPGERPSWCSSTLEPLSPPSAFPLPAPTCVYLSDGKGGLVRRTASWSWDEGEWNILVKKATGTKRKEKELSDPKEDIAVDANRMGRAKQRVYKASVKLKAPLNGDNGDVEALGLVHPDATDANSSHVDDTNDSYADEPLTDNDGWVYGDNKWKATSSNGGLGKYTRYRRWTRIALLTEVVEGASAEEARNHAARQQEALTAMREGEMREGMVGRLSLDSGQSRRSIDENDDAGDEGGLRRRLKAVIRNTV